MSILTLVPAAAPQPEPGPVRTTTVGNLTVVTVRTAGPVSLFDWGVDVYRLATEDGAPILVSQSGHDTVWEAEREHDEQVMAIQIDMAYAQDAERQRIIARYDEAVAVHDQDSIVAAIAEATRYDAAYPGEGLAVELCGPEQVAA